MKLLFPGWPINAAFVYMPRGKKFCVSKMFGNQRQIEIVTSPEFIFDYPVVEYLRVESNTAVLGHILSSFFGIVMQQQKRPKKMQ